MKREWGVNRLTGAMAVEELRKAGLVVTRPGVGTFVAATPAKQVIELRPGDRVVSRMPTEEERERLSTGYLTPVLIITRADGQVEPYNAAVTVVRSQGALPRSRAAPPGRSGGGREHAAVVLDLLGDGGGRACTGRHPRPPHRRRPDPPAVRAWSSCTYRLPRSSEATAAIRQATIEKSNAICRPAWNGPVIRLGKKECPVR